jgi:ceramide glucosyltransferase
MDDDTLLLWLQNMCVAGAVLGCAYTLLAAFLVARFKHLIGRRAAVAEPVTLLKPLCGDEPGLTARLESFLAQDYAAPVQVVLGVQDRADPAIAAVEALREAHPQANIALEVNGRNHGSNRKVSNLANMAVRIRHGIVVLSDSDIDVGPGYLGGVIATLQQPGVGAVTCLYHGVVGAPGLWPRMAALAINTQFLPNAVVAISLGLAKPCFGATIALRAETLKRLGGFPALADTLADDYALGEAVRAGGQEVAVAPGVVGHACFHASARELFLHQVRSARTIRTIDPVGYIGSIVTNPLPFALAALATGATGGVAALAAAIACRLLLCRGIEHSFGLSRQDYWLLPARDLFDFAVYTASFFAGKVSWKGYRYRVNQDGNLIEDSHTGRT